MRPGALAATDELIRTLAELSGEPIPPGLDPRSIWHPPMAAAALALPALRWSVALGVPRPRRLSLAILGHLRRVRLAKRIIRQHLEEA